MVQDVETETADTIPADDPRDALVTELRVDLIGSDVGVFDGEVLTHRIPALAWAGRLVGLGYDPATIMGVYRNGTLETRIFARSGREPVERGTRARSRPGTRPPPRAASAT